MRTQSPERIDEILRVYPAAKGHVRLYRQIPNGPPTSIHVGVKRVDQAFLGFRPMWLNGPCFLSRSDGSIGVMRQQVDVIMGDHTIAERISSTLPPNVRDVRDAFRGRKPSDILYFVLITETAWHSRRVNWAMRINWNPLESILRRQLDVSIRIPPRNGGFASLLSEGFSAEQLYYSVASYFRFLAERHPSIEVVDERLNQIVALLRERLLSIQLGVRRELFTTMQWKWRNGKCEASVTDSEVSFQLVDSNAGIVFRFEGDSPQVLAFHGTLGDLDQLADAFLDQWIPNFVPAA